MWQPASSLDDQNPSENGETLRGKGKTKQAHTQSSAVRRQTIKDHRHTDVKLIWNDINDERKDHYSIPPFSYEIYLLRGAQAALRDVDTFSQDFLSYTGILTNWGGRRKCRYHLEIYTEPCRNILACLAHHRKEVSHRILNNVRPRLVSEWDMDRDLEDGDLYESRIIVIDQDDWISNGPILVLSDRNVNDDEQLERILDGSGGGGFSHTFADRINTQSVVQHNLIQWWGESDDDALYGRRLCRDDSPVRYPAQDPTAHYDVEHDEAPELEVTATNSTPGDFVFDSEADKARFEAMDTFDQAELYKSPAELRPFCSESYSDPFGSPVITVWNAALSRTRPAFSFTLYLAFDVPSFEAEAIFACLNKGLISRESWTLDIVRNIPSIDAALDYHSRTSARRTPEKTAAVKSCTKMLLNKTGAGRLPSELLEYIEDLVVPPEVPDYSNRPTRPFRNVFMYLSRDRMNQGPLLVYSHNASFWADIDDQGGPFAIGHRWRDRRLREHGSRNKVLEVRELPFWNRVSDEMHTLWSLCSPRSTLMDRSEMPALQLTLKLPETIVRGQFVSAYQHGLRLEVDSSRPILMPRHGFFSHNMIDMYDIIDESSGTILAHLPDIVPHINSNSDSWAKTRQLGFDSQKVRLAALSPGCQVSHGYVTPDHWWEEKHYQEGLFVDGRRYTLRLRKDVVLRGWAWETARHFEGPYNLPPVPVMMSEESKLTFRYRNFEGRSASSGRRWTSSTQHRVDPDTAQSR